jgi:hypothetical protein
MFKPLRKRLNRKGPALNTRAEQLVTVDCPFQVHCPYLEYPLRPEPRYGYGKPPHPRLYEVIDRNRAAYRRTLESFLGLRQQFLAVPLEVPVDSPEPCWINDWIAALDSVALFSLLCLNNPGTYLEIGSGWSTKFARRAVRDGSLRTRIVSIDPCPRAEIDSICDEVIRKAVEDVELSVFDELDAGDILFVDATHRCSMNSDVAVIFLDVLPRLRPGVLVQFHDIYLPYDYPDWCKDRYYSEQYLLAVHLLADSSRFDIVLPCAFVHNDPELRAILAPLWEETKTQGVSEGESFWMRVM